MFRLLGLTPPIDTAVFLLEIASVHVNVIVHEEMFEVDDGLHSAAEEGILHPAGSFLARF